MSKTICKVLLLGNVGKDPDVRSTPSGSVVANFSIATTNRYKDGKNNWQEKTVWANCSAFGKLAEVVRDYIHKGSKVYVEGRLDQDTWQDKQTGQNRTRDKVVVSEIVLLDAKEMRDGQEPRGFLDEDPFS